MARHVRATLGTKPYARTLNIINKMVQGECGKCGTIQELTIKSTGKKDNDWCYWCPKCLDRIDRSTVILDRKN